MAVAPVIGIHGAFSPPGSLNLAYPAEKRYIFEWRWDMNKKAEKGTPVPMVMLILVLCVSLFFNLVQLGQRLTMDAGFRMPDGDAVAGEEAFAQLQCNQCHTVAGVERFSTVAVNDGLDVHLGGEVRVVKSYGELVTAIVHPDESIRPDVMNRYELPNGRTLMPDYTARMTTRQMVDLVTFLQEHYEVAIPEYPGNYYPYGIDVAP
jgi:mono/diheme cytochrome c family protein